MEFRILGPLEVLRQDEPVAVSGRKQKALLACLLLERSRVVPVERLIDELWPGDPPASAAHALQVYVSDLRKAIGTDRIEHVAGGYRLRLGKDELDLERFQRLLDDGRPAEALALWRGPALAGVPAGLLDVDRRRLEELRRSAQEARIDAELAAGGGADLVPELETLVAEEPFHEHFRAQLMLALYRAGRQTDALAAYREGRRLLVEELGAEPGRELRDLQRSILLHDPALETGGATPSRHDNLPERETSFVGRDHELTELGPILEQHRLVTLTGPGGTGKTTLAVELARADRRPAWLVELAAIENADLVPEAVLHGLGLQHSGDRTPLEALVDQLARRTMLVVLDNCEHVLDAAGGLAGALLRHCPGVAVLATSRESLEVEEELVWPVPPLLTPGDSDRADRIPQYAAVRLFLDRAQLALTPENSSPVAMICRGTAGIPLAIELAAGRVPELDVQDIAARLAGQLDLLVARGATGRHSAIERTIDWTYRLLLEPERELFAQLSVFAGGWTAEAAEAVCGAGEEELARLARRSLLSTADSGRYGMLEPIRQYAARALESEEDADRVRERHAAHFVGFAERVGREIPGPQLNRHLRELQTDFDNVRSALGWTEERRPDWYLRIMAALWYAWSEHPYEGRQRLERSLDLAGSEPGLRAWLLNGIAFVAWEQQGDWERAGAAAAEAAEIAEASGGHRAAACAMTTLGSLARDRGNFDGADDLHRRAAQSFARAGDDWGVARSTFSLGLAASWEGRFEEATTCFEEARDGFERVGDVAGEGYVLQHLGRRALVDGELDRAESMLTQSLGLLQASGRPEVADVARVTADIARVIGARGDHELAIELTREALEIAGDLGGPYFLGELFGLLADAEGTLGRLDVAATLLGAADALYARLGAQPPEDVRRETEHALALARAARDFDAAWRRGQAMSEDEAVELVLALTAGLRATAGAARSSA